MLLRIIRYIKGYLCIRVIGYSAERFINACSHRGIRLWGLRPVNGAYEMNITISGFRQLKPIIRKTGTKVVIVRRSGLPFFLHKYRRRKLFFAGAFLCVGLILLLSRYIWNIDISGNLSRTDETLLAYLNTTDVKNGMAKSDVDCARIVKDIRKEFDDIIWVSASIRGTRLMIQIKENEDSLPSLENTEENGGETEEPTVDPTDIVADQDCIITEIVPRNGVVQVHVGDTVKEGDILVSGQVPVNNDAREVTAYQYHESDADIRGQTSLDYKDVLDLGYEEKKYQTIKKEEVYLQIGNWRIGFGSVKNQYKRRELYTEEYQLCLWENFYLPVIFGKRSVFPYEAEKKKYSREDLQKILTSDFLRYCEDLEKKGVEIIENNVKIYTGSKKAEAKGTLTVIMPVGKTIPSERLEVPVPEEENESGE